MKKSNGGMVRNNSGCVLGELTLTDIVENKIGISFSRVCEWRYRQRDRDRAKQSAFPDDVRVPTTMMTVEEPSQSPWPH